jgi:nitroimidazol reductase NimA-like FMN-containing flavoprotein (pyridoxamine 5'-phosphate oxidase superfamily)
MSVHMRRMDKQITDAEKMKEILESVKYVTVALCMDNTPYLVTLSHGYERKHNCIYFHCASEGKKIEFMKANDHVWGQALNDLGYAVSQCNHLFETVQFSGKVTFLNTLEEKREALECMIRHLEKDPEPVIARIKNARLAGTTFGRIDIEHMTGKQPERPKQQ